MRATSTGYTLATGALLALTATWAIGAEAPTGAPPTPVPTPVAYWNFDDVRDGMVPDVAGDHPGTLHGKESMPKTVPGIAGQALRFDAKKEQYVSVAGIDGLGLQDRMTLMAWIWVDRNWNYRGDVIGYLPEQNKNAPQPLSGFRLSKTWACGSVQFLIGDGSERVAVCDAPGLRLRQDHWMHVAATHDGKAMRVFVNAVERASCEAATRIAPSKRPLIIGNYVGNKKAFPFHGVIDEVRLYDVALTQDQILRAASEVLRKE